MPGVAVLRQGARGPGGGRGSAAVPRAEGPRLPGLAFPRPARPAGRRLDPYCPGLSGPAAGIFWAGPHQASDFVQLRNAEISRCRDFRPAERLQLEAARRQCPAMAPPSKLLQPQALTVLSREASVLRSVSDNPAAWNRLSRSGRTSAGAVPVTGSPGEGPMRCMRFPACWCLLEKLRCALRQATPPAQPPRCTWCTRCASPCKLPLSTASSYHTSRALKGPNEVPLYEQIFILSLQTDTHTQTRRMDMICSWPQLCGNSC